MKAAPIFLIGCLALQLVSPAVASGIYLAQASKGAGADYGQVAATLPLLDGRVGQGPGIRLSGDFLDYTYQGGAGEITATGWGGALAGVYQFSGGWGWSNLSAGLSYRDTRLSQPDPNNKERGAREYFNMQADGGYNLDPDWRVRGLGSFTPAITGYLVQAGLDRAVWSDLRLGISTMFQGDRYYHQASAGVTGYFQLANGLELDPAIGVSHANGQTEPYGGLTLVLIDN